MRAKNFFCHLFGRTTGLIELRSHQSSARIFTRDFGELDEFIADHLFEDIWFGAATRKRKDGSKNGVFELPALWVDLDWKDFKEGKNGALRRLKSFPLEPSIVVETGGGFHVYWLLRNVPEATVQKEAYLKGLASALGGDPAAAEIARVLRVPGTRNYKYTPPRTAKVFSEGDQIYRVPDFKPWKAAVNLGSRPDPKFANPAVDLNLEGFNLSQHIIRLILSGPRGGNYRSRSEADAAVITALVRAGASDDEIRAVFQQYPIGEKYLEKGASGDLYLGHSIGNARKFLHKASRNPIR